LAVIVVLPLGLCTWLAGHVSVGGTVSYTSTLALAIWTLSALSVAVHVTSVVPRVNVEPLTGTHTADLIPAPSLETNVQVATAVGLFPLVGVTRTGYVVEYVEI
jgi:hypothetical protein